MDFFPTNFLLQPPHEDDDHRHHSNHQHQIFTSWIPQDQCHGLGHTLLGKRSPPIPFLGFEACGQLESPKSMMDHEADLSEDDGSSSHSLGEKKKIRLNMEQVKALEKSFESGNKLDPERKLQLARALGLQPRQVAIWFQNRRARWKTKQLEKDYDLLKRQFDSVKADNDALQAKNQKLQEEIMSLKGVRDTATTQYESINLNKDTEGCGSSRSSRENSSDILRLNVSSRPPPTEQDHENINQHNQSPVISRQLFPPSTGFGSIFSGITSDHHSGLWPWFDQQQPQQQHLS